MLENLLWYSNHLEDIEADVDEDWAGEVSLQHLISLFAVSLLAIWFHIILILALIIIWLSFDHAFDHAFDLAFDYDDSDHDVDRYHTIIRNT